MHPKFSQKICLNLPNFGASGTVISNHRIPSFGTIIDICIDCNISKKQPNQSILRYSSKLSNTSKI